MIMKSRGLAAAAVVGASLPLLIGAGAVAAHAAGPDARPAEHAPAIHSAKVPSIAAQAKVKGLTQVSASFTDAAQAQSFGSVACPTGTKAVGGGAVIAGSSLNENLNESVPQTDGSAWLAYVNNANTTAGSFTVFANCAKNVQKYSIAFSTGVDDPAGTQRSATATCPTGTVPLGGGGANGSSDLAVLMNSSLPVSTGWRADINNNGGGDTTISAEAICGKKPSGYVQVSGPGSTYAASTQGPDTATCPTGTSVLGGGGYSSSGLTSVDLNSSYPIGTTQWRAYVDNTANSGSTITAYAVCAKA